MTKASWIAPLVIQARDCEGLRRGLTVEFMPLGRLRHRLHAQAFDGIDPSTLNLVELPCDEAGGLIFVKRTVGPAFAAGTFLQGLDAHLHWMGLPTMTVFRKVDRVYPANWKLSVRRLLGG